MMHIPAPKNLLATVPKLNCIILKQNEDKSRSGTTNVMHAEQVLKDDEIIFRNIERKNFSFNLNVSVGLFDGELFFLKERFI
jgi:hypothetical protein